MTTLSPDITYCANHPDREATLRCNRCDKPICLKCAVRMPTGYRCRQCVSQQQQIFETALWYDYLIGFVVAFVLSAIAGALLSTLSWFVIFLAPVAGGVIGQVVMFAIRKRRSKYLPWVAAGGVALGGLALCALPFLQIVLALLLSGGGPGVEPGSLLLAGAFSFIWPLIYVVLSASTVFYSLKGIRIN